jgi:hypothetical protein
MPYELIPMLTAAILSGLLGLLARRQGCSGRDVAGACLMFFAGLTLAGSMAVHSGEIWYNQIFGLNLGIHARAPGTPQVTIGSFSYDFRFYSLQLFGGALLYLGGSLAVAALGFVQGVPTSLETARKRIIQVLLFVAPLIPMHIFAVATAVIMGIACVGLVLAKGPQQDAVVERRRFAALTA